MSWISAGDFIELYVKFKQRGTRFILSKFNIRASYRTISAFNDTSVSVSNWWDIPKVRQRWNQKITGDINTSYEDYFVNKYLSGTSGLSMLSVGCGSGNRELRFAANPVFTKIIGLDISLKLVDEANAKANKNGLKNVRFVCEDFYTFDLKDKEFDIVLFHSSLHHFKDFDKLLGAKIKNALKYNGYLIINEYVGPNRLQWKKEQLEVINDTLVHSLPASYKKRYISGDTKNKVYRPGILRMLLSDPSEAVDSENIIPAIHNHFKVIEEKNIGGNILMPLLKDIAYNFISQSMVTINLLNKLFEIEDEYLKKHPGDIVFGVYRKN